MVHGQEAPLDHFPSQVRRGSDIINGTTREANAEQTKERERSKWTRKAISPTDGMENIYDSLHENEDPQPPAQQAKVPPKSIRADLPDEKTQQTSPQQNGCEMEFLQDGSFPSPLGLSRFSPYRRRRKP
jgi:hypothetical protein